METKDKYILSSENDPDDAQLLSLMQEVTEDVKQRAALAEIKLYETIEREKEAAMKRMKDLNT